MLQTRNLGGDALGLKRSIDDTQSDPRKPEPVGCFVHPPGIVWGQIDEFDRVGPDDCIVGGVEEIRNLSPDSRELFAQRSGSLRGAQHGLQVFDRFRQSQYWADRRLAALCIARTRRTLAPQCKVGLESVPFRSICPVVGGKEYPGVEPCEILKRSIDLERNVNRRGKSRRNHTRTLSLPTVVERILRPCDTTGCKTSCEATVAIVEGLLERRLALGHDLKVIPLPSGFITCVSTGYSFGWAERTNGACFLESQTFSSRCP